LRLGPALARKSTQLHSRLAYSWAPTMCRSAGTRRIDPTPAPRGLRHLLRFAVASSAIHWHLLKFVTVLLHESVNAEDRFTADHIPGGRDRSVFRR
jgi:hypothetical protein